MSSAYTLNHPYPPNNRGSRAASEGAPVPPLRALPAEQSSEIDAYLRSVDALLVETVTELIAIWADLSDDGPPGILGESDLPQLIAGSINGGKCFRAVMSYLGWLAAGGRERGSGHGDVVQIGAALEMLQLFVLVHDDVMDESASRRGRPTVHIHAKTMHETQRGIGSAQRFGESIAVLVGDLAHAEASNLVADLSPAIRRIWRILVAELVAGQRRDLAGSATGRRDLGFARSVARMKSGRYTVQRPLELGAAAAGADPAASGCLHDYGLAVGEAFALRDDLLGIWGDPAQTGKPAGDDLISGKPTVVLAIAAAQLRSPSAKLALQRAGSAEFSTADLTLLREQLASEGIVDTVEALIAGHVATALTALDTPLLHPDGVAQLTRMAHQIAWRDK